jgi:ATP-dependent Clp protease ATP-binding subunit ClpB
VIAFISTFKNSKSNHFTKKMTTSLNIPLSAEVKSAIQAAQRQARAHHQATFGAGHLLWGLLHSDSTDCTVIPFLQEMGQNVHKLTAWAEQRVENAPKSARSVENPPAEERANQVLQEAVRLRIQRGEPQVNALTVLEALCTPDVGFTAEQLRRFPLALYQIQEVRARFPTASESVQELNNDAISKTNGNFKKLNSNNGANNPTKFVALEKYCEDVTARARQGKIDPVIGREKELKQLQEILGKRLSPNVLLTGEPGVGKTAVVGGLALELLAGKVSERLRDASIFELDVSGRLVAGAYKGEVEERLKAVLQDIKNHGKAILFIDEIHTLLDPQGSVGSGAVNLLKPELARGELTVIGATTEAEYRQFFETDPAFKRRFTLLNIAEPSESVAVEMLQGLVGRYEAFHQVKLAEEAMPLSVQLAKRYLGDKKLPSAALEVMDVTMAAVAVMNQTNQGALAEMTEKFQKMQPVEGKLAGLQLQKLENELQNRLSHLLTQRLEGETDDFETKLSKLKSWTLEPKTVVTAEDIAATIAYMTGIPMGKIQAEEQKRLLQMETLLEKRVIGQEHALKTVAAALRRSRAGLREGNKPAAAFFFLGPTGTGKTELTKAIAELLFNDPNALIRFDMSEFKEEHSAALLYGSPPGYVGYKEGGLLVNKIRQKPYSVVLFDEVEKAHKSVYDVFLQILDEGMVHDKQGKKGDFTKAIVIFTSNIGSEWIVKQFEAGKTPSRDALRGIMSDARMPDGSKAFRPEMLGRGMHLTPFAPITEGVAGQILDIHLRNFAKLLKQQEITFEYSENVRKTLTESGFSPAYGARPLKDTIEERIATPLSDKIIGGEVTKGCKIWVDWDETAQHLIWNIESSLTKL